MLNHEVKPVNFGRDSETGRYASAFDKALLDPIHELNKVIRGECGRIFKLLEDHYKHAQDHGGNLQQSMDRFAWTMDELADKFGRHFNEQGSFGKNLTEATKALGTLNAEKYEGIIKHKPESTRVEITNLDKGLKDKNENWINSVFSNLKASIGLGGKDKKLEVRDDRVAHALEHLTKSFDDGFAVWKKPEGLFGRLFQGMTKGTLVGATIGTFHGVRSGLPLEGAGVGAVTGAAVGAVRGAWKHFHEPEAKPSISFKGRLEHLDHLKPIHEYTKGIYHEISGKTKGGHKVEGIKIDTHDLWNKLDSLEKILRSIFAEAIGRTRGGKDNTFKGRFDLDDLWERLHEAFEKLQTQVGNNNLAMLNVLASVKSTLDSFDLQQVFKVFVTNWPAGPTPTPPPILPGPTPPQPGSQPTPTPGPQPPAPTPPQPGPQPPSPWSVGALQETPANPLLVWQQMTAEQRKEYQRLNEAIAEAQLKLQEFGEEVEEAVKKLMEATKQQQDKFGTVEAIQRGRRMNEPPTSGFRASSPFMPFPRGAGEHGHANFFGTGIGEGIGAIMGTFTALGTSLGSVGTMFAGLSAAVTGLLPVIVSVGIVLAPLIVAVAAVAAMFAVLVGGLLIAVSITNAIINAFQALAGASLKVGQDMIQGIAEGFSRWSSGDFFGGLVAPIQGTIRAFDDLGSAILGLVPLIGGVLADVFKSFLGAIQTAITVMTGFAQQMIPFVQQISPSTVENFNYQMRGLQATIGTAFTGFISIMSDTISKIAGSLLPVMQELSPLFTQLGGILRSLILPIFRVVAAFLQSLVPVIQATFNSLRNAVVEVVKSFVLLAAIFARFMGATGFLDNLIKQFEKKEPGPGATPAGPASISSFEQISKDIAVAAAQASASTAAAQGSSEKDLLQDVLKELRTIKEETTDQLIDRLQEMWQEFMDQLIAQWDEKSGDLMAWLQEKAEPVIKAAVDAALKELEAWAERTWRRAGDVAIDQIQRPGNAITGGYAGRIGGSIGDTIAGWLGYDTKFY